MRDKTKAGITTRDRYRGVMLGGACGDALGLPVEFLSLPEIKGKYGVRGLTDFAPCYGRVGSISDDTQMSLFVAEGLLRALVRFQLRGLCSVEGVVNHALMRWLLTQGYHPKCKEVGADGWLFQVPELHALRAPGTTCITALQSKTSIGDLYPSNDSKGAGCIMRTAPVALMFGGGDLEEDTPIAFELACNIAKLTHGHPTGHLASGAMTILILQLVAGKSLPEALTAAKKLLKTKTIGGLEVWAALTLTEELAGSPVASEDAIARLGRGWVAEEALAIAVFCCLRGRTLEEAVILAANHDGDSDTVAAVTGNLAGALYGVQAIPARWLARLELREVIQSVADDLLDCGGWDLNPYENTPETERLWQRYPGW